jgi:hypothetical protein
MKARFFILFMSAFFFAVCNLSAQTGKDKKTGENGVSMSKGENKLSVKSSGETLKGVQVDTKSVEEIIGSAALCKYSVKLKDPAIFNEQGVCWGKNPGPAVTDNKITVAEYNETVMNGEMTGLDANTKYYVRAYVTTTAGTVYGKELSFTTASGPVNSTYWIRRR